MKQPLPSLLICNSTPSVSQSIEIELQPTSVDDTEFINQTLEITQSGATEPILSKTVDSINSKRKVIRKVTNCSPDTTTSPIPQYSLMSAVNSAEITGEMTNDAHLSNPINYNFNAEKRLGMVYDDFDNDIPSPVYSPYAGRRKIVKQPKSSTLKTTNVHSSQINSNVGNSTRPIDLSRYSINSQMISSEDDIHSTEFTEMTTIAPDTGQTVNNDPVLSEDDTSSAINEISNEPISNAMPELNLAGQSILLTILDYRTFMFFFT